MCEVHQQLRSGHTEGGLMDVMDVKRTIPEGVYLKRMAEYEQQKIDDEINALVAAKKVHVRGLSLLILHFLSAAWRD